MKTADQLGQQCDVSRSQSRQRPNTQDSLGKKDRKDESNSSITGKIAKCEKLLYGCERNWDS